jgi:glucose-6-phosphate isomerase
MTITVNRVDPKTLGILIALFERAVGYYGSLVNINAYHQPGVEAGKKAAAAVLALQAKAAGALSGSAQTADQVAQKIGSPDSAETVYLVLEHLAANGRAKATNAGDPSKAVFSAA